MANSTDTYRTVTPYLVVRDADAELAFLKAAFGATEQSCQRNSDNTVMHAEITIGDSLVMLGQAGGPWKPRSAALYLWWRTSTPPTNEPCALGQPPTANPKTSRTGIEMPE
jgi:PhnB protein